MSLKLHKTKDPLKSCDTCESQEGHHYCLLHTKTLKNMNIIYCNDWKEKEDIMIRSHKINTKTNYIGKWIRLDTIEIIDKTGKPKEWEVCRRVKNAKAVIIIAYLYTSERLILIREFRPAVNKFVIAFPAGLFDNLEDPIDAAIRELKEETGYVGHIAESVSKNLLNTTSSPGIINEHNYFVKLIVDDNAIENKDPKQSLEDDEDIEVFLIPFKK